MTAQAETVRRRRVRRRLRGWYRREGRDLPWRRTADPWAVLVSETMLQQTQAQRVAARYPGFLARFPTPEAMAAAAPADVVAEWAGLGYNRRAVALHGAATAICERHGGAVPAELDALEALPGVGPYTARAVRAFAFDLPAAPVDTNVARVLARLVAGAPASRAQAQALADELAPRYRPGEWASALMELGALVCTARRPRCDVCPVAGDCAWAASGAGEDPSAETAHRSRPQGTFAGSDRQARGRLVDALRRAPIAEARLGEVAGVGDPERLERVVARLVADGLAERDDGELRLPGG
jgi:A/G-specific adenine glycosylase